MQKPRWMGVQTRRFLLAKKVSIWGFYMTTEEQIMELKEKQAFWPGVVRGVIGSAVFFAGLVTLVYYMVQLISAIK